MGERETETIAFLNRCFEFFKEKAAQNDGEFIKETGDGAMLVFQSSAAAVNCAMQIQKSVGSLTGELGSLAAFRIGIHVGETIRRSGDVFGNAVNIAARLETLANPGGICISHDVYRENENMPGISYQALGRQHLKNIAEEVVAYLIVRQPDRSTSPGKSRVAITTIGGMSLEKDGEACPLPRGSKARAMLAFVSASPEGSALIGSIGAAIWPGRKPGEIGRLVDRVIDGLKETVPVEHTGNRTALNGDRVQVDLTRMERDLLGGKVDPVFNRISDWPEQILHGYESVGSVFASWLAVTRNDWRTRLSDLLEHCLDRFDRADMGMREAATALLRIEPAHERAARALIRHYRATDNPGEAKRVLERFSTYLRENFGLEPKPETVAALEDATPSNGARAKTARKPLRIQIGEFSADHRTGSDMAASLRSELIASLASFRGWSVVEVEQPSEFAPNYGDYRLSGVYRQSMNAVDLSLVEPASNRTIWAESLPLQWENFQKTKKSIVGRVAATLEVYVSTDRVNTPKQDASSQAVDRWLRGERLFSRWTPEDHDAAADIFERLIGDEPDFAPPYASLASLYNVRHIVRPGIPRDAVASHRAYQLSERAAELDPLDARNQLAIAWSASLEGDFDKASLHMNMAARLNPNSPRTIVSCAMGLAFFGDHDSAGDLLEHSLRCAPLMLDYQWCYAASVYFLAGDYESALTAARRGRDRIIDNPGWHAATLVKLGKPEEASQQFRKLVEAVGLNWNRNEPATPKAVFDWFTEIYPMRRDEEKQALAGALADIAY